MKEAFTMWRHTRTVALVALTAAIYAAALIPSQFFVIVPGFTNFRPGNAFPFVFGLLFGPAGAWGAAIGNLINDFFGRLLRDARPREPLRVYRELFSGACDVQGLGAFFRRGEDMEPNLGSRKKVVVFVGVTVLAPVVCAVWIAWGNDLLGFVPFAVLGSIISINNAIAGLVLGPILLVLLYPRIKRWGLLWTEIMPSEDVSAARFQTVGKILVWVGGIGALVAGLLLGGAPGGLGVGLGLLPLLALVIVGSSMLGGREQVEAADEADRVN